VNAVTVILVSVLFVLLATGLVAVGLDLSKIGFQALDRRRALRACRHGWDWQAFESALASYAAGRHADRRAAHRRR
jgi:hypothetical protein